MAVERLRALASQVLSPRTGLLKQVRFLPWEPGQIRLQHPIALVPNYSQLPCGGDIARPGGSSSSFEDGLAKAIFEGLERYSAAFVDYTKLIRSKPVDERFLAGERLPLFADFQYAAPNWPFRRLGADSDIFWLKGLSLYEQQVRYVPASQVYIPYQPTCPEECLGPSTSTGMAAGWTRDDAVLNGLMEVIERDALMIMWMNRLSMPHLRLAEDCRAMRTIRSRLADTGAQCSLIDLTTDLGVPTVLALMRHRAFGRTLTTVGLSAKPDYPTAALKAFYEAVSDYERIRVHLDQNGDDYWRPAADFSDVTDFEWHGLAYISDAMQAELAFVDASSTESLRSAADDLAGDDARSRLRAALARLRPFVGDAVVVDIAPRDVAGLGVHVTKVFVPDLVPVNPDHRFPWLGHRRLYEVPVRLGYRQRAAQPGELNPLPHPFS
jgi:ribosomal protein S12 methylthiotransferase accessory factor